MDITEKVAYVSMHCVGKDGQDPACSGCPYNGDLYCFLRSRHDALEIAGNMIPRLMTPEEIKETDEPVWLELNDLFSSDDGWNGWAEMMYTSHDDFVFSMMGREEKFWGHKLGYNISWRCWNRAPHGSQRVDTEWLVMPAEVV